MQRFSCIDSSVVVRISIAYFLIALTLAAFCRTDEVRQATNPIDISNSGVIEVDQEGEYVKIEGEVEVHQAPFYLSADSISWKRGINELMADGNVQLFLVPEENRSSKLHPFLRDTIDPTSSERIEILHTDTLAYDAARQTIRPFGTTNVQLGFARIIGEDFDLNLQEDTIRTGNYRVGFSNLFFEGDALYGEEEQLIAENAHFFIGEPEKLSVQGHAREIEKQGDDAVILRGVRLQLGPIPFFYWPYFKHHLNRQVFSVSGGAGYSGDIGAYLELRPTYQPTDNRKFFTDINFYSERGVLLGPGWDIAVATKSGHRIESQLETGYIRDNGNLGFDILGEPIDGERHFIDFEFIHHYRDSTQVLGRIERWSDSEILRDFETEKFRSIQQPQTFVEIDHLHGPFAVTLSSHIRHEAFEYAIERTPEINLRLLPSALLNTGFYHSAELSGSKLHDSDPNLEKDLEHTRLRAYYQLLYPVSLAHWLDFTPQATAQRLKYSESSGENSEFSVNHYEVGFDLTAHSYGEWNLNNEIWEIFGIRHILNPTVQYRRIERSGSHGSTALPIEAEIFRTGVPDIDLTANSHLDELESYSVIRMGIMNSILTKGRKGRVRELLDLDLYYDTYMSEDSLEPDESLLALNLSMKPAYWIDLNLQSRFDTDPAQLKDLFARLQLIDGDIWDLDIATQFIHKNLQQYIADFRYKVFENVRFVSTIGFDVRKSRFFEQEYGLQFGIANYWDLFVSVNLREGSTRNNETRFELKIKSAQF